MLTAGTYIVFENLSRSPRGTQIHGASDVTSKYYAIFVFFCFVLGGGRNRVVALIRRRVFAMLKLCRKYVYYLSFERITSAAYD